MISSKHETIVTWIVQIDGINLDSKLFTIISVNHLDDYKFGMILILRFIRPCEVIYLFTCLTNFDLIGLFDFSMTRCQYS